MRRKDETIAVIAFPNSGIAVPAKRPLESETDLDRPAGRDVSLCRAILLGETLFHREALARAFRGYGDVALIGSVTDVHTALMLAEERFADVLIADSPSDGVARAIAAHPPGCRVVFIGVVSDRCRELESRGAALLVQPSASLDELHVALRAVMPRTVPGSASSSGKGGDANLTIREQEVSRLVAAGYRNKEIADVCGISVATVKNHVHRILGKLNCQRRAQIAGLAVNHR